MLDQNTDRLWYVIATVLIGGLLMFGSILLFEDTFFYGAEIQYHQLKVSGQSKIDEFDLGVVGDGVNLIKNSNFTESTSLGGLRLIYGSSKVNNNMFNGEINRKHWASRLEHILEFDETELGDYTYSVKGRMFEDVGYISWMNFEGARVLGGERFEGYDYGDGAGYKGFHGYRYQSVIQETSLDTQIYSVSFRVDEPGEVRIRGYIPDMSIGDRVEIDEVKLENGTKSTMD